MFYKTSRRRLILGRLSWIFGMIYSIFNRQNLLHLLEWWLQIIQGIFILLFLLFLQFHSLLYRYVHQEQGQPHKYSISWTVAWTLANDQGGHFYNCDYGVHIQGGDDTIVVWDPLHFHGTSLQDYLSTSQTISEFNQIGLAIVTPSHFPQLWEKKQVSLQ